MRAAVLLCLLAAARAEAAPAPRAVPPKLPALAPSSVVMTWRGIDAETHFHADGHYTCLWAGRWWEGRWTCKDGTLTVEEWPRDSGNRMTWAVKLATPTAGRMVDSEAAWSVRPLVGRVD